MTTKTKPKAEPALELEMKPKVELDLVMAKVCTLGGR